MRSYLNIKHTRFSVEEINNAFKVYEELTAQYSRNRSDGGSIESGKSSFLVQSMDEKVFANLIKEVADETYAQ